MTVPLIGFIPGWIILLAAVLILMYYFGKDVLHVVAILFLAWLAYFIFHTYF